MKTHLILLAAGQGQRLGNHHKAFTKLLDRPMLYWSLRGLDRMKVLDEITVVVHPDDLEKAKLLGLEFKKVRRFIAGGKTRQESAYLGLKSLRVATHDLVLFHNVANLFVSEDEISKLVKCINLQCRAAFLGQTIYDSPKRVENKFLRLTYPRENMARAQTPQALPYDLALRAHELARKKNLTFSDDVGLVEELGVRARHIECSYENFKITTREDLSLAEKLLKAKSLVLYGIGEDSHRFSVGKSLKLILGTVLIPKSRGLEAESDGDLILHAICNAISSALSEGSIGTTATALCKKGIKNSTCYLEPLLLRLKNQDFVLNNLSLALEAKTPLLENHLPRIKKALSRLLKLDQKQIGLTVTSGEGLSAYGRGEGIKCTALVSLLKIGF